MKKQQVQRQFNAGASQYAAVSGLQQRVADDLMQQPLAAPELAVDLGCGTGQVLSELADRGSNRLIGVDIAPAMVQAAQRRVPSAHCLVADIEALPLQTSCADLVVSCSALQWCELSAALAEMVRITKPGGRILLSTFTRGTLAAWRTMWGIDDEDWFVQPERVVSCAKELGLVGLHVEEQVYRPRFASFADVVASIRDLGAGIASRKGLMSPRQFRAIRQQVDAEIQRFGYFELQYCVTRLSAQKRKGLNLETSHRGALWEQAFS
jgi:malonyl-CoA O-methyltransferase